MKRGITNGVHRMTAVLCMLGIMFLSCPAALTVRAQGDARLAASAVTAERKSTAAVTVTLEGNPGIWGLKFKVGYDHSALTLQTVEKGNVFEEKDIVLPDSLDREQFVFAAAANELEDIAADGNMITLNFLVGEDAEAGSYPITLELTQAINVAGEDVKITVTEGSITVKADEADNTGETDDGGSDQPAAEVMTTNTKTGDAGNPLLWIVLIVAVLAIAGGGICCVLYMRRRHGDR